MAKQLIGTMVISIHSARVGGDLALESNIAVMDISIHSARVGGDGFDAFVDGSAMLFQSTPPVWAETCVRAIIMCSTVISIHSARVGGDPMRLPHGFWQRYFNPLRPCGRRLRPYSVGWSAKRFQSTPPVWAETIS